MRLSYDEEIALLRRSLDDWIQTVGRLAREVLVERGVADDVREHTIDMVVQAARLDLVPPTLPLEEQIGRLRFLLRASRSTIPRMNPSDQVEDLEFTCPKCGSHKFGTALNDGALPLDAPLAEVQASFDGHATGFCHGTVRVQRFFSIAETTCGFTWPRSEDAKYFRRTGRFRPRRVAAQQTPR